MLEDAGFEIERYIAVDPSARCSRPRWTWCAPALSPTVSALRPCFSPSIAPWRGGTTTAVWASCWWHEAENRSSPAVFRWTP